MRTILVPFGTRPEIVKLAPIVEALRSSSFQVRTLATSQHADPALADVFFRDLGLRPDVRWNVTGDGARRLAAMTEAAERELESVRPDLVMVLGDTHTVPTFCLAARRHAVPVVHLEAGLRSRNERSVEEVNRKVAAACASLHLAPTEMAAGFLASEGIEERRIRVVGNPIVDVLRRRGVERVPVDARSSIVVTAHRASNVDDPRRLSRLVELVGRLVREVAPVRFPVHPRTRARLVEHGLEGALGATGALLLEPLPYDEMLGLVASSRVVVTDSGGLQEEAAFFGVPVVVLRRSTPRWEGVSNGTSALVGLDVARAVEAVQRFARPEQQEMVAGTPCPYGDGHTSERVVELLAEEAVWGLLALEEPDLTRTPLRGTVGAPW